MKRIVHIVTLAAIVLLSGCQDNKVYINDKVASYKGYNEYPSYNGGDLGVNYSPKKTFIKLWSPGVQEVKINIYNTDSDSQATETLACFITPQGVWIAELKGDYKNKYYTFQVKHNDVWSNEEADPYAKAVGTNGKRGMIVDMAETNPQGWAEDKSPALEASTDIIIYELHIRDLSISPTSGIVNKGKYIAFTEDNTKSAEGLATGIDHIAELGATHVHLLPSFDYCSVDESRLDEPQFNWGYDPQNYNVPDGSYSTNPSDAKVRINEYKQMVQAIHKRGLRVVMDVVYNHTGMTKESNLDQLVPGYYYRQWDDGTYSDASACNNEVASDRDMVRKFIVESVKYWVKEYHVDGFRFDLMAIHDQATMNLIAKELKAIDPSIFIYGEGWTANDSPLPEDERALKKYVSKMPQVAVFSDDIRDAIKGDVFVSTSQGFVNGNPDLAPSVMFGIVASGSHPQIDYSNVNYSKEAYTDEPSQVINYVSCHDNNTLYDKLKATLPKASHAELTRLNALSNAIVLTSQGIPFLHAGVEMNRTKNGEHNSYNLSDKINQIDWTWKAQNIDLFNFYKNMIAMRKAHPAFRMPTNEMIQKHLVFDTNVPKGVIAYTLKNSANGDAWKNIYVLFNGSKIPQNISLPTGDWTVAVRGMEVNQAGIAPAKGVYHAPAQSAVVLFQ